MYISPTYFNHQDKKKNTNFYGTILKRHSKEMNFLSVHHLKVSSIFNPSGLQEHVKLRARGTPGFDERKTGLCCIYRNN